MKQIPIVMPQMGQSVAEGTVLRWCKQVGEAIAADEVLLEVETDKTTVEVESPASGKLSARLKQEGEIAAAGEVIGLIEADAVEELPAVGANAPHVQQKEEAILVAPSAGSAAYGNGGALPEIDSDRYSPYVMRLAMLNNVTMQELDAIRGTGRHGRVTKNDVMTYLAHRPIGATSVKALAGKPEVSTDDLAALGNIVSMTSLRRTIADHMVRWISRTSWTSAAASRRTSRRGSTRR